MKKFFATLLLVLGLCSSTFAAPIEETASIAIMDLGTHEGAVPHEISILNAGKASSEYLIQRLFQVGKFNLMDRRLVEDKILAANLNTTGLIDPDTAKKIGKILGADYLVYGNVNDVTLSETGASTAGIGIDLSTVTVKAHIIVRVMEIKSGRIIGMAKGEGLSKGSFVRIKGGEIVTVSVGRLKVTQDSVHNALQKSAFATVDKLIKQLY